MIHQKFISNRFDEAAILATLTKIAFTSDPELKEQDYAVLAALRRSSNDWNLSIAETSQRLASYDNEQISGLVNNIKGILHEMEFVRLENNDGDSVVAALYPDTNHKSVDVQMTDESSGQSWSIQLKATNDSSAVNSWLDSNPDTEIIVTEELAEKMDLSSSGFTNEEISVRVRDFVDRMIDMRSTKDPSLWEYFPPLVAASAGIIVFELWRRYKSKQITLNEFKHMTALTLGIKAAKYGAFFASLSVPGLNVLVGAYLLASLILHVTQAINDSPSIKPFSFIAP